MISFYYSEEKTEENAKRNLKELSDVFSNFDSFDEEAKENYIANEYIAKITAIASHLHELKSHSASKDIAILSRLLKMSKKYNNFDPRYVQEFSGKWSEKIDIHSKIAQKLEDILQALKITNTKEAKFVLFNSLKYLGFCQRREYLEKTNNKKELLELEKEQIDVFAKRKEKADDDNLEALIELSKKPFDDLEMPFNGNMHGFCRVFADNENKILAKFTREEFERYLLMKQYDLNAEKLANEEIVYANPKELFSKLEKQVEIKGEYSDDAVISLEKTLSSNIYDSFFIREALKNARRTRTKLSLDGKKRDGFLAGTELFANKIELKDVGNDALRYGKYKIRELIVEKAGDLFGHSAEFNANKIIVEKAGNWFGYGSEFNANKIELKNVGNDALTHGKYKIRELIVEKAGDWFGYRAEFNVKTHKFGEKVKFYGKITELGEDEK